MEVETLMVIQERAKNKQILVVIVLATIVLCTLGALLPAVRAARLAPAEALRYE
jgi:ABC-type lipoprotein release transport system permease subunit